MDFAPNLLVLRLLLTCESSRLQDLYTYTHPIYCSSATNYPIALFSCSGVGGGAKAEGQRVVGTMLPFLLSDGVTSPVKDAQTACLSILHDIVKVAGPLLRPHIPDVVSTALGSMSNMVRGGMMVCLCA